MKKEIKKEKTYDFDQVKKHIENLPTKEKISYLIEAKTDYLQNFDGWDAKFGASFDEQCELEIKKITAILELENNTPETKQAFKLCNTKGLKMDLIRVLNALHELKFFEKTNGQPPTKEEFMTLTGAFFGVDLSKYDIDLSQSLNNTTLEANIKIFDKMKDVIQKSHYLNK